MNDDLIASLWKEYQTSLVRAIRRALHGRMGHAPPQLVEGVLERVSMRFWKTISKKPQATWAAFCHHCIEWAVSETIKVSFTQGLGGVRKLNSKDEIRVEYISLDGPVGSDEIALSTSSEIDTVEARIEILQQLQKIGRGEKELMLLLAREMGYSWEEIGKQFAIEPGTACKTVTRLKARLCESVLNTLIPTEKKDR